MLLVLVAATGAQEQRVVNEGLLGLMPKHETGALRFLEKYPEYDGRGVVVAIFDSGVDPGAAGLHKTSDGKPKIIDLVDATGSGDVEMTAVRKPENGTVVGLSGRPLKLDSEWKIPSGEVRVGMKLGVELFPPELRPRIVEHRRRRFLEQQREAESDLRRQIEHFEASQSKVDKAELEKRLERLVAAGKDYDEPGPVFDCVVFHDGDVWRAVVDTDEDGDLAEETALTNFRAERQYATFDAVSLLNFAVNIYDEGQTLSLVVDSNPHGTHVAGIVAAHYPDKPEWNGVAPGAQIVSVKIGDTYLDAMETPAGLTRAVRAVLDNKCDLINMSFGEPTKTPDRGLIVRLYDELVDKHGVIFCSSAGNAGPALSTVGAPGGTTTSIIGVGAYISPEMMSAAYTLRQRLPETAFSWTSRGPAFDGDMGVDLFAPGAAIAPVPQWTLDRSQRMNGTSMASPNCCGNIALAVSGLKARKIAFSPISVERAFANTARRLETADVFAQGAGLIQVDAAFEALLRDQYKPGEHVRFEIQLPGGRRGIYLREPTESGDDSQSREFTVQVKPAFDEDTPSTDKVDVQLRCELESTAEWVACGEQVTLTARGQSLSLLVDPRSLDPGAHFAEVLGFDADDRERGPLFRIPVTVTRLIPSASRESNDEQIALRGNTVSERLAELEPAEITRRFVAVPTQATWADLRLRLHPGDDGGRTRMFMVHAVQAVSGLTYRDAERNQPLVLQPGVDSIISIPVESGRTLELAIAQFWSSLGTCELDYELTFHGVVPDRRTVELLPGDAAVGVDVGTSLAAEYVSPAARLTTWKRLLKPASSSIRQLSRDRDLIGEGRVFSQLELKYELEQAESGRITPRFSLTDDLLYDSEYGGAVWAIFESGGRRVATDDVWPHEVELDKGKYTLKLWVRHFESEKLERLKNMPLTLERPLPSAITLPIYGDRVEAMNSGSRFSPRWLQPGDRQQLFIGNITKGQLPNGALAGDVLSGTVTYGAATNRQGASERPEGFPLSVVVSSVDAPTSKQAESDNGWRYEDPEPAKSTEERVQRAVRNAKTELLASLSVDTEFEFFHKLANEILSEHTGHLPVLVTRLHKLDDPAKREERLDEIIAAADAVLAQLSANDIASALAFRATDDDKEAAKRRSRAESEKKLLVDTLYRKGRALGHKELPEVLAKHPITDQKAHDEKFEQTFRELQRWVDTTDQAYFLLHIRHSTKAGKYGESLKWLDKYIPSSAPNYWYLEKRRELYEKLGWHHLEDLHRRWRIAKFPGGEPR